MTQYKSSDTLINAIKSFEGCRLMAYKPTQWTEKYHTIGYGHYGADVKPGMEITESEADELLRSDLSKFEIYVNKLGVCKSQGQFDALVDFSFNLGTGALGRSTLLKKIRAAARTVEIQVEIRRWVKAGGKRLPGLEKRRAWEAKRWAE